MGETIVPVKISVPDVARWDIDHPNLYVCEAALGEGTAAADSDRRTFGFRWFAPDNIGTDAILRLNGQRIVLRSAIRKSEIIT
jgi:beta-galactosidase/beta-glucuronidase